MVVVRVVVGVVVFVAKCYGLGCDGGACGGRLVCIIVVVSCVVVGCELMSTLLQNL